MSSVRIQDSNKLQEKVLQTSDTVEPCGIAVLSLPVDLINSTLDIPKPSTENLAIIAQTLAYAFLSAVVARGAYVDRLSTCFPLARELRIAHAQQLCAATNVRRCYSHQLANSKLMALPQHERLFGGAPSVRVETGLNLPEQVHQMLVVAALFCGETHELGLRSQNVCPAEILAEQEGGVDY